MRFYFTFKGLTRLKGFGINREITSNFKTITIQGKLPMLDVTLGYCKEYRMLLLVWWGMCEAYLGLQCYKRHVHGIIYCLRICNGTSLKDVSIMARVAVCLSDFACY